MNKNWPQFILHTALVLFYSGTCISKTIAFKNAF